MGLTAYDFAGVAYEFSGGLWLSTFHGSLRQWLGSLGSVNKYISIGPLAW